MRFLYNWFRKQIIQDYIKSDLSAVYDIYREEILKYYHHEQFSGTEAPKMEKAFVDSNGKVYYKYTNDYELPLQRMEKLQELLIEMQSCLTRDELGAIISAMEKALGDSSKRPDIAKIGYFIHELKLRREMLLHPDILFKLVCVVYIREDQDPYVWDEEFEKAKCEQLRKDSQGGLYSFFYNAGLMAYLPYLKGSEENWIELMAISEGRLKAMQVTMESFSTASD